MALQISVAPVGEGWSVQSDALAEAMSFDQGARAEQAARSLADHFSRTGRKAEVSIFLRDGALAGKFVYPATA